MKNTIFVLFTLFSHTVFGEVIINGYCDFPKATVSLFEIEDYITKKEIKI